jgi:hypothetical protein
MNDLSEAQRRKTELNDELYDAVGYSESKAVGNYRLSLALMALALSCSLAAGVLGIFTSVPSKIVGGIAVLPPLIAYIAVNLKLEDKSSWHYRKGHALRVLKSRLMYQLPEAPTVDNVAAIADERDKLHVRMQEEWERSLRFNWAAIMQAPKSQSSGSSSTPTHAPPNPQSK